jgi:phage gp45-like
MIGTVTGFEIGINRDGTKNVLKLQVQITDTGDIQTVEYMSSAGDDTIPPVGSIVTILSAGSAWKIAIASQDNIAPSMNEGERKIYSSSGGVIKAFINWLNGGNLELNGNGNSAVTFTALNTALQILVTAINATFATKLDGGGTAGAVSLDISAAEENTVRLP